MSWVLLERLPQTRLGKLRRAKSTAEILELCDKFNVEDNEYYFDRHPRNFGAVINFYRTGRLHMMEDICVLDYSQDLEYWGVDSIWLETCCETKFSARKQFIKDTSRKEKAYQDACKVE